VIDEQVPGDVAMKKRIVQMVDRMVVLQAQLATSNTPHAKSSLQSQIAATDGQIDALVYELYGLTDEEIRIVEGETGDMPTESVAVR
jgi:hypothetical protein